MRDIPQIVSIVVTLATLSIVIYKSHRLKRITLMWIPIAIISVLTLGYYVLVFIDRSVDIINSSNLSAFLRLSVQIMLLLYAWYMPPARQKK